MPRHKTITDAAAQRFRAPKTGTVDHFDGSYPGLHLRVAASGLRTWGYFYRLKNGVVKLHRLRLGVYPALSVEAVHDLWRKAFDLVQSGRDPRVVLESGAEPSNSFQSVFEEWFKRDQAKNRSAERVRGHFNNHVLPAWRGRLITDIDRRTALGLIEGTADTGKVVLARRLHAYLHRMFRWCVGRGIIPTNPLTGADRPGEEKSRTRVLSDGELVKVWLASEQLPAAYRDAFRLLVLTGARREEITKLRWGEIRDNTIHLDGDRTKNGEPHIIPLSTAARAVLPEQGDATGLVFTLTKTGKAINDWPRAKQKISDTAGVDGWRIHDLRRTCATGLQKLGVQLPVTEAVLGHTSGSRGGIVGVYQTYDYAAEKAAALEAWGAHVMALVDGSERGKVVAYGRR